MAVTTPLARPQRQQAGSRLKSAEYRLSKPGCGPATSLEGRHADGGSGAARSSSSTRRRERRASRETHLHDGARFLRRFHARTGGSARRLLARRLRHRAEKSLRCPQAAVRSPTPVSPLLSSSRTATGESCPPLSRRPVSGRVAAGSLRMPLGQRLAPKPRETLDFSREGEFFSRRVGGVSESRALTIDTPRSSIHAVSRPTESSGKNRSADRLGHHRPRGRRPLPPLASWTELATVSFEVNEGKREPQC